MRLERATAGERFRLRARAEELSANLSLEAWLERVHSLTLPTFDTAEDLDPAAYMAQVAAAVSPKAGWSVEPDVIVLGFFSFAKFLMYRDLDPAAMSAGLGIGVPVLPVRRWIDRDTRAEVVRLRRWRTRDAGRSSRRRQPPGSIWWTFRAGEDRDLRWTGVPEPDGAWC